VLLDQFTSHHAEHCYRGQVGLEDQPLFACGEIAYRRKIIKVGCSFEYHFATRSSSFCISNSIWCNHCLALWSSHRARHY